MSTSSPDSSVQVSNLLKCHPEVLPQYYARIACDWVAEVPFQAAPEVWKLCQRIFNEVFVDYVIFSVHLFFQCDSESNLGGVT
jgi:hypothetical protein